MGDQAVSLSSPALAQGLIMSIFYSLIEFKLHVQYIIIP